MKIQGTIEISDKEIINLLLRVLDELQFRNRVSNK